jgi:hypothetical protein
VRVAHGTDDGKSIPGIRHVQVGEQHVEVFRRNKSQRFVYAGGRYHFEPAAFQAFLEHGADVVVVVHEKDSTFRDLVSVIGRITFGVHSSSICSAGFGWSAFG